MRRSRWMAGVWRRSAFLSGLMVFVSLAFAASNVQADQARCGQVLTGSITLGNDLLACAGDGLVGGFSGAAFHLAGGSSSNFVGRNTVAAGNGEAIVVEGGSDHNRLEGNALSGSSDSGIRVDFSSNTVVIGNQVAGGSDAAITMTGAPRSVVQSNNVHGVGDAAILLTGSTANVVRFNTLGQSADAGVVLSGVSDSLIKANTMSHAGDAAISLLLGSSNVRIIDNQASHSSDAGVFLGDGVGNLVRGNGITVNGPGTGVNGNLATGNGGWGIYALSGVLDRGANGARSNAEAAQCYLISCSDGRDWVAPVRPPEPLDPLEIGLEGGMAPPPELRGLRRAKRRRLGVVICGQRRASRAGKRGRGRANAKKAKKAKPKMVCKASYRARPGSRRLTGRLVRDDRSFAGGRSKVRRGRRGRITMTARTRPRAGRYTLVLTFRNRAGKATVVRKPVRVR